jgi:hypothetical protein
MIVRRIVWAPDSSELAFEIGYEDGPGVFVLDIASHGGGTPPLPLGQGLGNDAPDGVLYFSLAGWTDEGILLHGRCADCSASPVRWVDADGSLVREGTVGAVAVEIAANDDGFLYTADFCFSDWNICTGGGPLRYESFVDSGTDEVIREDFLLVAATFLP